MADNSTKPCACCKQDLPRTQFYKRPANKDGLYSYCRLCCSEKAKAKCAKPEWKAHKSQYDKLRYGPEALARAKAQYEKNPEARKAYAKEWAEKNPERRRAIIQSYKHRRRSAEGDGMSGRELGAWKKAQAKICYWCGCKCAKGFHVDHYVPLSKGGKHEADNLVIACRACNYRKHAKDPFDFARECGRLL